MKAVYVYNPHSSIEVQMIERVKTEFGLHIEEVGVVDFDSVRDIYGVRATPALILIRDDMQGEEMLDGVNGQLRVTGELLKALEEEELNIHQMETHRIDYLINVEKAAAQDELLMDLLDREVL